MRRLLVGGAVRDKLLGLPVKDRDWLVLDCNADELLALGYKQVGQHFAVFLHPQTGEEHALPRRPKGAVGPSATPLEEDLRHRDLTINAMAQDENGTLIDPCNGQADLQRRLLRHAPGFADDPLRILRVARFAAQLRPQGFTVDPQTLQLMREMVAQGELRDLPGERAFAELRRALQSAEPQRFFEVLRECAALDALLPELERLFGIPQPARHHPEIDTGIHSLMVLQQACQLSDEPATRLAALLHDLGKGLTPASEWPRHIGHEQRGVDPIRQLARRLRLPKDWRDLALLVARYHLHSHRATELKPSTLLRLFEAADALRRPQRFEQFLLACAADARGRTGFEQVPYPQADYLRQVLSQLLAMDQAAVVSTCSKPQQIPKALARARTRIIAECRLAYRNRRAVSSV
jgi:tRNA nucleotidyltransferase (CCA-adding enzyme)